MAGQPTSYEIIHVSDDEKDRKIFKEALFRVNSGMVLRSFTDCDSMVRVLIEANNSKSPDAIFLDMQTSDIQRFSCLKELRAHPLFSKTLIIMLTGSGSRLGREVPGTVGANLLLHKPADLPRLTGLLSQIVSPIAIKVL
jgi:CheY-like chemotaxis protein